MGEHGHRGERVALNLGDHAVEELDLDPAPGIALEADGVDLVGRIDELIGVRAFGRALLRAGKLREAGQAAEERGAAAGDCAELDELTA